MRIYNIKPYFQKTLVPIKNICLKFHVNPTTLNLSGVIASLGMALSIVFYPSWPILLLFVPLFALVRTALNALDGMVARELTASTAMGEVLNEFLDRLSDAIILSSFIFVAMVSSWVVVLTVALVILSSYLGILSKAAGGPRMYAGVMGKADRMFYIGVYAMFVYFFATTLSWDYLLLFISLGSIATLIERLIRINKIFKTI